MKDITIIVKTSERFKCLDKFLKSVFKYYPDIKVLIADDSMNNYKKAIVEKYGKYNIEYYVLDYDVGVSFGRNFLLNKTTTPYFLLCDDDFVFDKQSNLEATLKILQKNNLDIIGGYVRNYKIITTLKDKIILLGQKVLKYELPTNYIGSFDVKDNVFTAEYRLHDFPVYEQTDIVVNFFIAKTSSVKKMGGWDKKFKIQDHTEFFYRAKLNKLKVAFTNSFSVKHMPIRIGEYKNIRERDFTATFMKKYNFEKMVLKYDEKSRNVIVTMDKKGNITRKRQE